MKINDDKIFYATDEQNRLYNELKTKELDLQVKKEKFLHDYDTKITVLHKQQKKILDVSYFDKADSFQAICYLINKLENKNYQIHEIPIELFYNYYCNFFSGLILPIKLDYKLACLIEKNKEEQAITEIKERFKNNFSDYPSIKWETNFSKIANYLSIPSNYYIQLAYFKDNDSQLIRYQEGYDIDISLEKKIFLKSKICDSRYNYVIDYINYLVNEKLNHNNLNLNPEEMKELANSFIDKKQKILTKIKKN